MTKKPPARKAAKLVPKSTKSKTCPPLYQVVAECESERQQRQLFVELKAKGYQCRLLSL
ncbi:hypothetical protein [Blastopirellula retiformator]|uniref:Uncharacterized protein n=1 Tax=Blastopirellula retiformator TaxID=2527970 RepID=A0A5C5V9U6_9BACT|nr:hypothetical protein [Blastopirellula retiformator]TWT34713.1 hypothetical protein Enr8_21260 [Blastopirellula retiformator]